MLDKSYKQIKQLEKELEVFKNKLENVYWSCKDELQQEIIKNDKQIKIDTKEANELWKELDYNKCTYIIKKILPFKIRLFNKITCCGYGVTRNNRIEIEFYFNNNISNVYTKTLYVSEIKSKL